MRTDMSTLCYIEQDHKYLMLHRVVKKNDVNKDKWIGVGGHFEADESPEECLLREVWEETGYTLTNYRFRAIVTFVSGDGVTEYAAGHDNGNVYLKNGVTLKDGDTYVLTVDLTKGTQNAVLRSVKK